MPRGVPKAGFRKTRKRLGATKNVRSVAVVTSNETDAEIRSKLEERFSALELMTECAINGDAKAVVISGPAGLGKSFGVTKILDERKPFHTVVRGYVRATGLYKTLYEYRAPGSVVVFDDADSIFADDISLNLLKAACDTTKRRVLSWLSESKMEDEEGERVPRSFEFEGTVIFITNYDFDQLIERGNRLAPHFQALISRSMYLDMAMKTNRDYLIRIKQVVEQGMLNEYNLNKTDEKAIISFIEKNQDRMRELSLRIVVKIAALVKSHPTKWESLARIVCCK